jgi:hypothetical protein
MFAAARTLSYGVNVQPMSVHNMAGHVYGLAVAAGMPVLHCGAAMWLRCGACAVLVVFVSFSLGATQYGVFLQVAQPWLGRDGGGVLLLTVHGLHVSVVRVLTPFLLCQMPPK